MKRLIILLVLILTISHQAFAQDTIITKEGDVVKAYNVEISSSAIFYKSDAGETSPIQRIEKNKVFMIKHSNGTKTTFDENSAPATPQPATNMEADGNADEALNAKLITAINDNSVQYVEDGKKKKKESNYLFFQYFVNPNSLLANKDIEVTYASGELTYQWNNNKLTDKSMHTEFVPNSPYNSNHCISVSIKNKTDKTIYIDLGSTYFIRNGEASAYYVPGSTSNTTGNSIGIGVGLGAIANATGLGGVVGHLASGVSVGGGQTNTTTTTTYSQRVISVPPMSSKKLDEQIVIPEEFASLFPQVTLKSTPGGTTRVGENCKKIIMGLECMEGDLIEWNEETSPIKWGAFITYAFDENITSPVKMKADFFLKKAIALRVSLSDNYLKIKEEKVTAQPKSTLFFFVGNKF